MFVLVLTAELVLLVVIVMGKTRGVIFGLLLSLFTVAVCFLFRRDGTRRLKIAAVAVCLLVARRGSDFVEVPRNGGREERSLVGEIDSHFGCRE